MNIGIILIMVVGAIALMYGLFYFVRRYGILDILIFMFVLVTIYGLVRLLKYTREGYHV